MALVLGLAGPAVLGAAQGAPQPKTMQAVRIQGAPPRIDGILDDPVWREAPVANGFTQREPDDGKAATETTLVQVAYDDAAVYFGVLNCDREPDAIVARLVRRDQWTAADRVEVVIDAHHDHQTAHWFQINAAGTLEDGFIGDDGEGDWSWDPTWNGVWEARQARVPQGWSAEFRIPFHALRFSPEEVYTWGIQVVRRIPRKKEEDYWVPVPRQQSGYVSRFGHLEGIRGITPGRALEVLPYGVGRFTVASDEDADPRELFGSAGADLRYGLSSSTSLNATVNPDFGQVEADPSQLNLTVFESFQEERRPFFVEGAPSFQTPIQLFYSRRIGRQPGFFGVPDGFEIVDQADLTTILAAAKLTGKTAGKTTFGLLQAATAEEHGTIDSAYTDPVTGVEQTVSRRFLLEPRSHFLVGRAKQDLFRGNSHVGLIGTVLNRQRAGDAYAGGADWKLKWRDNRYDFWGQVAGSHSRDEDGLHRGWGNRMSTGKRGGWFQAELWWEAFSRGFEVDDLGFQDRSDIYRSWVWMQLRKESPWGVFRKNYLNGYRGVEANFDDVVLGNAVGLECYSQLANFWWVGVESEYQFRARDDLDTRGGPLIVRPSEYEIELFVENDGGSATHGWGGLEWARNEEGGYRREFQAGLVLRPAANVELRVEPVFRWERSDAQWIENVDDNGDDEDDHFVYGRLRSKTLDLTSRANLILSRDLSLEFYLQPFLAVGEYDDLKELARPDSYEFTPRPEPEDNPDFDDRSLQSNLVLRWEYRPGSTLFLVWSQSRDHSVETTEFRPVHDLSRIFADEGTTVFLVKLNYWMNL
jgi:hypothetical protein